jgi:TolA-binding protein
VRGQAFEGLGEMVGAARAYLASFSAEPTGKQAPEALYKLGFALGQLGQVSDACLTLTEVGTRFPGNPILADVEATMTNLGCS